MSGLDPDTVRVELYADGVNGEEPVRQEMKRRQETGGRKRLHLSCRGVFGAPGDGLYGASDTALHGVAVPLEEAQILWQR